MTQSVCLPVLTRERKRAMCKRVNAREYLTASKVFLRLIDISQAARVLSAP